MARSVLIIDDDAVLTDGYRAALALQGWVAELRVQPDRALEELATRSFDAIVVDSRPAKTQPLTVAELVRRTHGGRSAPMVVTTRAAGALHEQREALERLRAVDFLEKPITPEELAARLRIALGPAPITEPEPLRGSQTADGGTPPSLLPTSPTLVPVAASLRGDLSGTPFHAIFARAVRERVTGLLTVRRDKVKKFVTFAEGRPVGIRSNLLADCLGRILTRAGTISDAQCAQSLEQMKALGLPQGRTLVALGLIDERQLDEALEVQLAQKFFDLFSWSEGDFTLHPRTPDDGAQTRLDLPALRLMFEGLARSRTAEQLWALIGPRELAVKLLPGGREALATLPNARALTPLTANLDGRLPLSSLVEAKMVPPAQALALVVALRDLGLAEQVIPVPGPWDEAPARSHLSPRERIDLTAPGAAARLEERIAAMMMASPYVVLGVPRCATWRELIQARDRALAEWQTPAGDCSPEARALLEELRRLIRAAHDTLSDDSKRSTVDEATRETPLDRAERVLRSDETFRAGRAAFDGGRYAEAREHFRSAAEAYGEEAGYHAWLGLATWQAEGTAVAAQQALEHLAYARALHPALGEAITFEEHVKRLQATGRGS